MYIFVYLYKFIFLKLNTILFRDVYYNTLIILCYIHIYKYIDNE